jgi:hypothetical protein
VRRQAAPIAHQADPRQGHQGCQLLQEFQRRQCDTRRPIRPRVGESVDEIASGVLLQALQCHRASGRRADQSFQLVEAMRGNLGVRGEGKPVDTGTARPHQGRVLTLIAKPCANAPALLSSPLAKGNALLSRGRQGVSQLGFVRRQVLRGGYSIPQGHGHRHDPLAGGDPATERTGPRAGAAQRCSHWGWTRSVGR